VKLSLVGMLGAVLILVVPPSGVAKQQAPRRTVVTVIMTEFKDVLSVASAPRGLIVFKLVNKGQFGHNFAIAGKKSAIIGPSRRSLLVVTFTKAGRYHYRCTAPGHAEAGMKGVLAIR
jgi:hypothetical protein